MIFSQDRDTLRRMWAEAWRKRQANDILSPLEAQIADVIAEHPEYHDELGEEKLGKEYRPEDGGSNPFLHMGMHLAIREQVATNRPAGIRAVFQGLTERLGDPLDAEHRMIDILAETLWTAQRDQQPPDEAAYLEQLRRL